jgi:two-component system, LuxR family, response regulator FixJ
MHQKHHTVYIVDDDDDVRDSLRALLEACDFTVRDFSSGRDFLVARRKGDGDCLLLDLHMPQLDGVSVLAQMRAEGSELPAIVITGRSDPALKQRALQNGAFAFFGKPVPEDVLLNAIDCAIASRATNSHVAQGQTS